MASLAVLLTLALVLRWSTQAEPALSRAEIPTAEGRLRRLEPPEPVDIENPLMGIASLPTNEVPVQNILRDGKEIQLRRIYDNPTWTRLAYRSYWHSTVSGGRWSRVPTRLQYAMHRLFVSFTTASIYYDFVHDLGIADISGQFARSPMTAPFDSVEIVVMQAKVRGVRTMGNQIVIVAEPMRDGLEVYELQTQLCTPTDPDQPTLFQLVTPEGYEIDYTTMWMTR